MPALSLQDNEAFARMAEELRLAAAELRCRTGVRWPAEPEGERHPAERLEEYASAIAQDLALQDLAVQHLAVHHLDHGALRHPRLASMR